MNGNVLAIKQKTKQTTGKSRHFFNKKILVINEKIKIQSRRSSGKGECAGIGENSYRMETPDHERKKRKISKKVA